MADYLLKQHHSFDLGTIRVAPTAGSLVGSRAVMRIGRAGTAGSPEQLRFLLDSDEPPDGPALFSWEQDEEDDEVWILSVRLSKAIVDEIGAGGWGYELSIVGPDGEPIWGESGTLRIAPALPETTSD